MKMAFALIFIINGIPDESKTLHLHSLQSCLYLAQEISKSRTRYEPTETLCKLVWVDDSVRVIR